jgi:hypothetical protein
MLDHSISYLPATALPASESSDFDSSPPHLPSGFAMLLRLILSIAAALAIAGPLRAADRPNIVVILSDDYGWGSLRLGQRRLLWREPRSHQDAQHRSPRKRGQKVYRREHDFFRLFADTVLAFDRPLLLADVAQTGGPGSLLAVAH